MVDTVEIVPLLSYAFGGILNWTLLYAIYRGRQQLLVSELGYIIGGLTAVLCLWSVLWIVVVSIFLWAPTHFETSVLSNQIVGSFCYCLALCIWALNLLLAANRYWRISRNDSLSHMFAACIGGCLLANCAVVIYSFASSPTMDWQVPANAPQSSIFVITATIVLVIISIFLGTLYGAAYHHVSALIGHYNTIADTANRDETTKMETKIAQRKILMICLFVSLAFMASYLPFSVLVVSKWIVGPDRAMIFSRTGRLWWVNLVARAVSALDLFAAPLLILQSEKYRDVYAEFVFWR